MKKIRILSIMLIAVFFFQANAQNWNEIIKTVASDRDAGDRFGYAVSISGNYAIVGACLEEEDALGENTMDAAGSAYIFKNDGDGNWNQVQKIVASDRGIGDWFGEFVSISDDFAIVGAKWEDHDVTGENHKVSAGSAYIFEKEERGNWIQVQKLVASDRAATAEFGYSVSISNNYAIVGAHYEDRDASGENNMDHAGAAYLFKRDVDGSWDQVQKIVSSDRRAYDFFGVSVSISGNYAIAGAIDEDEDASGENTMSRAGSAYIFEMDDGNIWNQAQKIVASDRAADDRFGVSVAIDGDYAIVGAHWEDEDASGENTLNAAGSAYIFEREGNGIWNQVQKIVASDRDPGDAFGESVSINSNYAVVGSKSAQDVGGGNTLGGAGSAYIFGRSDKGTWSQAQKIVASDRDAGDGFGVSVAIDGGYAIVGAYLEDEDANGENFLGDSGSAYIFELDVTGITENNFGSSFIVYPNPTSGKINIDLGKTYSGVDITVKNLLGQVSLTKTYKSTHLADLEINDAVGIYFIEIRTTDGKSALLKVVKE